jgi:hypothetical protein
MIPQNSTTPTYYKAASVLKEWPGGNKPNPDGEALQLVSLPDGPNGGSIEVLCETPAGQTVPVFVEPYAFLETLYGAIRSDREKHSPEWHRLVAKPIKRDIVRALG